MVLRFRCDSYPLGMFKRGELPFHKVWDFRLIFPEFEIPGEEFCSPSAQEVF